MRVVGSVATAVGVAEFKRAVHIIEGVTDDDARIDQLLKSAQASVEAATRRPLVARDVVIECRGAASARWWFPCCPVQSVASVAVMAANGSFAALDAGAWRLEQGADEPQILFADAPEKGALLRVTASVGHGPGEWPAQLSEAVIILAKEWLDAGIALESGGGVPPAAFGVRALMRQVRYARPAEWGM